MRTAALVLAALALMFAVGCKSAESAKSPQPQASTYEGEGKPKIKFGEGGSGGGQASSDGGSNVIGWVLVPFENVLYLPWKLVGGGLKGAADGVGAGFAKDRMPYLGALFSPLNAVAGFVTGAAEGVALKPMLIGPSDNFGYAMGRPLNHATTIWWYE